MDSHSRKVIIVDWDDTILPSTFVDRWQIEGPEDLPLHMQNMLSELSACTDRFLKEASKYGKVIIITNSDEGWVSYSAAKYCPQLLPVVSKYPVVSARTRYEKFYPSQPLCWKAAAFAHEVNEIFELFKGDSISASGIGSNGNIQTSPRYDRKNNHGREIVSFGDSMEERTATIIVSEQLGALPKSVMLVSCPSPLEIIGQLHMLTKHMRFLCESRKHLDLRISTEQATRFANSYMEGHRVQCDESILSSFTQGIGQQVAGEVVAASASG